MRVDRAPDPTATIVPHVPRGNRVPEAQPSPPLDAAPTEGAETAGFVEDDFAVEEGNYLACVVGADDECAAGPGD